MRAFRIGSGIVVCASAWMTLLAAVPAARAEPNCACRYQGESYAVESCVCIDRGEGAQLACCELVLNNTSWSFTSEDCPSASRPQPQSTQQAAQPAPPSDRVTPAEK